MNFLFASVLVLLIVAPGLTFFRAYYSDRFSIKYSRLTITDQIFRSIIPGITAQVIAIIIINAYSPYLVRLDTLGTLLLGAKEDQTVKESFTIIGNCLHLVTLYHLFMIGVGALLGWQSRRLIRHRRLDRRYPWLRFDNKWFYLLSGEVVEFAEGELATDFSDASLIEFVLLDILVEVEGGNMLYTGVMFDYELENDGGIKSIQIRGAKRKYIKATKAASGEITDDNIETNDYGYYDIRGNILIIPSSQIINLNITYFLAEEDLSATDPTIAIEGTN